MGSADMDLQVELSRKVGEKNSSVILEASKLVAAHTKEDLDRILLYGSCARGESTEDSDIDIALLTRCDRLDSKKYSDFLADVSAKMMAKNMELLNFVCLPSVEFEEKKHGTHILEILTRTEY